MRQLTGEEKEVIRRFLGKTVPEGVHQRVHDLLRRAVSDVSLEWGWLEGTGTVVEQTPRAYLEAGNDLWSWVEFVNAQGADGGGHRGDRHVVTEGMCGSFLFGILNTPIYLGLDLIPRLGPAAALAVAQEVHRMGVISRADRLRQIAGLPSWRP
jgi:hypothetical protein